MIVRILLILLAILIAFCLFAYVFTGRDKFLNRAWQLIGAGFVIFLITWLLLGLENFT